MKKEEIVKKDKLSSFLDDLIIFKRIGKQMIAQN